MAEITINPGDWIRISTAAALLGVTRQGVYHRLRCKHVEVLTMDRSKFVRKSEIEHLKVRAKNS